MNKRRGGDEQSINLKSLFARLPNEDDDLYTVDLKGIVLGNDLITRENEVELYLQNKQNSNRFTAFYALLIISREYNNYSQYNAYVDKYANEFKNVQLYKIVMSTYYRNKGILGDTGAYRNAIRFAEDACSALQSNLAVKHHYAELIVLAKEEGAVVNEEQINKAIERLDDVIDANPGHAKYYCTLGRLFSLSGNYADGIKYVKKSLDLERGDNKDSLIRIGQYNYYLLQIKMLEENEKADRRIGAFNSDFTMLKSDLDSTKTQYLEYLAFFSSVLAFVLVSVNIVVSVEDFNKCAGLVLMFSGALIVVFNAFRMLLYYASKIKFGAGKTVITYTLGFLLMAGGIILGNHLYERWL